MIPKLNAAVDPSMDQAKGTIRTAKGIFLSVNNNNPKVKIVVGQGKPKVGAEG